MDSQSHEQVVAYVAGLVERARAAQKIAAGYTQEKVDELVTAITWETAGKNAICDELAKMALEETKLGDYNSKVIKVQKKCRGLLRDLKLQKSVGVVEEDTKKGLIRIAKPVGVIGALVPSTQPEMSPIMQAMCSVKARDAIIFAPHPRGKKTTMRTAAIMRDILKKFGAPEDLIICVENPTVDISNEVMRQCDLVIATGGQPMVRAAYSSGTPAFGVGAGNSVIVIDETADFALAAKNIRSSKCFDLAAGCSCDNSLVIQKDVYEKALDALKAEGAYLATPEQKAKLQKAIWPNWPNDHVINRDIVASPISNIAKLAGIEVPEGTTFILVEDEGSGIEHPFSGEKMCLVTAVYKYDKFEEAIAIVNANQAYSGAGHSCGIQSNNPDHILALSLETFTTRVVVNQPQAATNTGDWCNGMPFTSSLGCGTWGGNIASENIVLKHFMNNTWVIRPIPAVVPTEEELFGDFITKYPH